MRGVVLVGIAACGGSHREPPVPRAQPIAEVGPLVPGRVACRIEGGWEHEQPHELRFPSGKQFVFVAHPQHAAVTLTATTNAFVELSSDAIRIAGFVPAKALQLHPAKPFVVADYVIPGGKATLAWRGANPGTISFEVTLGSNIKPLVPARATRPCSELSIESHSRFQARDVIDAPQGSNAMLPESQTIALSIEPGAPPAAELRYESGDNPIVEVLDNQGGYARVLVIPHSLNPANDLTLVGWVSASILVPHSHGFGGSWGTGGGRGARRPRPRAGTRYVKCADDVVLVAELDGERHLVGAIVHDVVISVLPDVRGDDYASVLVEPAQLELAEHAVLLVKRGALASCAETSRP